MEYGRLFEYETWFYLFLFVDGEEENLELKNNQIS